MIGPKAIFLLLGDLFVLYFSLFLALLVREGGDWRGPFVEQHLVPFSFLFIFWILGFFVAGLYDLRRLRNNFEFLKTLWFAILTNAIFSIIFFYLIPFLGIAPKTNLILFALIFLALETGWRRFFNKRSASYGTATRLLLAGDSETARAVAKCVGENRQLGYEIGLWVRKDALPRELKEPHGWRGLIETQKIDLIVLPRRFKNDVRLTKFLFKFLELGVELRDTSGFYEELFRKIPLSELDEGWFLENVRKPHRLYDTAKRVVDFVAALVLQLVLLPLELIIALAVKLTSPGPVIYQQVRVGERGREFVLYKFRTMRPDAEKGGPQWKQSGLTDPRLTPLGRILVRSHLDELPQLVNIIKGELAFVGPRPERPEFTTLLREKIPYYEIRHLVKPGFTGWAQINYPYGASVEDAYEKLQYELYYIKNRSLALDLAIILKTLKLFFTNPK